MTKIEFEHGDWRRYKHMGCKCDKCRVAYNHYEVSRRARRQVEDRLRELWDKLEAFGAVVERPDEVTLRRMGPHVLGALLEVETKRVMILEEGVQANREPYNE